MLLLSGGLPALASAAQLNQAGVRLGRLAINSGSGGAGDNNDLLVTFKLNTTATTVAKIDIVFPATFTIATGTPTVGTGTYPATPANITTPPGALTVHSATNSTLALQVLDSSGNVIFTVDTQNQRVGINTATPGSTLSVNGGNNVNPNWPDGMVGTPLAISRSATGTYTVPAGSTLYIASFNTPSSGSAVTVTGAGGVVYVASAGSGAL